VKIDVRQEGNVWVVTPNVPLVIGAGERLLNETIARLFTERKFNIVLDMGAVNRIDSSGVDSLVTAVRRARENGGDAKLARLTPRIHQLLEITQLTTVFDIYPDVTQALA
jgi:anti-sigma B factor antagonist